MKRRENTACWFGLGVALCFLKNNFKYKNIYKWGGKLEDGSEKLQTFSYKVISTRDVMHNTAVCYTQTLLRE